MSDPKDLQFPNMPEDIHEPIWFEDQFGKYDGRVAHWSIQVRDAYWNDVVAKHPWRKNK